MWEWERVLCTTKLFSYIILYYYMKRVIGIRIAWKQLKTTDFRWISRTINEQKQQLPNWRTKKKHSRLKAEQWTHFKTRKSQWFSIFFSIVFILFLFAKYFNPYTFLFSFLHSSGMYIMHIAYAISTMKIMILFKMF